MPGGTELMGLNVFPRLNSDRFDIEVAFSKEEGSVGDELRASGLAVHHLHGRTIRGLLKLARTGQYDLVHFYGFRIGVLGRLIFRFVSRPTARVLGVRHLYPYERFSHRWAVRALDRVELMLSRITHLYVANSTGGAERLERIGVPKAKLAYVPNGLDLRDWSPKATTTQNDPPVMICVARFIPFKRHRDLLDALALLAKRNIDFLVRLVGSGPLEGDLRRQATDLHITSRIEFAGQLLPSEIATALAGADIFVLTSGNEGMPLSVMEAMATGLPVVGTDVNGTRDLVVDGETGYLAPLGDLDTLATTLESLVRDASLREAMGKAGRVRLEKHFSLDTTVATLEECYEGLLA
jgi:glycosyltransferase involved in cell wall biosynthesis